MAIKIVGTTVIDDSRKLSSLSSYGLRGNYDDFHPSSVNTFTGSNIDMNYPVQKYTMTATGSVSVPTFSGIQNNLIGKTTLLIIDRTTSNYDPYFSPTLFQFPSTPSWGSHRYWHVTITVVDSSPVNNLCTAIGYDEPGTASSSFSNFSLSGWDVAQSVNANNGFPEAWARLTFNHDSANNRVTINRGHGTSSAPGTYVNEYANYTGLTGITSVEAQYNVQSQACAFDCTASNYVFGPTPVSDGYNSGTYYTVPSGGGVLQFGWMAQANPNDPPGAQKSDTQADFTSSNPDIRIKIVCNEGTFYSTAEVAPTGLGRLRLYAQIGTIAV
jgi:hypothetical protein